ncbi:unnamed protein product [Chironomus riparius]|uniref:Ankyrin repeat-containing protein n=1 Tax=Chironomus riparius TaxID=315576 RepID=A0A9N9WR56_9DIPT|nr:unnamed protein product [Chironomus riparius]
MLHISPSFTEKSYHSDLKMNHINILQAESKQQKQNNSKSTSGSSSNANNNNNGVVYVDLGKVLLEAAKMGDAEKVQECIKNGAPFITDWLGTSALHVAAKNNFYDTCATLLRSGISKDAKTKVDRTPLHFAVFEGNFEICQLLIQHECSIDPLDMLKMTPLHWAIEKSYDNIAELLIENGANPHVMSKFLKTPYMLAKEKNNDFIVNLLEMLPTTPLSSSSHFDSSSVFVKTPTLTTPAKIKDEPVSSLSDVPQKSTLKRERFHSYDSADTKRLKASQNDAKNLTLQLLKEQMSMMTSNAEDNLIQSAIQSGRKIMLTEAGKKLLNDSSLNKFLKIPLNTTISSAPTSSLNLSNKLSPLPSPSSSMTRRSTGGDNSDVLEIFRETSAKLQQQQNVKTNTDILNIIRTTNDLQEVTITQRSSKLSPVSPIQKTGVSLSAINVPKAKAQNLTKTNLMKTNQLPSTTDIVNSSDFRSKCQNISNNNNNNNNNNFNNTNNNINSCTDDDFSKPEIIQRKYSELFNNYQQLKKSFEREQQKSDVLQRQLTQLQSNFESYKRQQQLKFDSILQVLLQKFDNTSGERNIFKYNFINNTDNNDDAEEVL